METQWSLGLQRVFVSSTQPRSIWWSIIDSMVDLCWVNRVSAGEGGKGGGGEVRRDGESQCKEVERFDELDSTTA